MWSQLARLKCGLAHAGKRTIMAASNANPAIGNVSELGPMQNVLRSTAKELSLLDPQTKHWICKGKRSLGIASNLLLQNQIIAIPTDTVYGFAGIASDNKSIKRLYEIKGRDEKKPLCISIGNIRDIKVWGVVDHLPWQLWEAMLPGPYTVILKRTPALNPFLNPGIDTVGIRVPQFRFINSLSEIVGPLALTSANLSNEPSCLEVTEFEKLWPQLGGIFHASETVGNMRKKLRTGSTIIDLSCPEYFKIVRYGVGATPVIEYLRNLGLKQNNSD